MSSLATSLSFIFLVAALLLSNYDRSSTLWTRYFPPSSTQGNISTDMCEHHNYTTEIISIDPLLIYINNFVSPSEAAALIEAGTPNLSTSQVILHGRKTPSTSRTSHSGAIPLSHPITPCILSRARSFMGTILPPPPTGDFATPQIVQYTAGQKFDLHHDWYERPQMLADGTGRVFNRPASFFVVLRANCSEGETWFQGVEAPKVVAEGTGGEGGGREKTKWREYEKGGTAFRPVPGNALFWVNLLPDGRGDTRTMHAGLPVGEGMKTAMNIWPRRFYED